MSAKKKSKKQNTTKRIVFALIPLLVILIAIGYSSKSDSLIKFPIVNNQTKSIDFGNQTFDVDGLKLEFNNGTYSYTSKETGTQTGSIAQTSTSPSGQNGAAIMISNPGGSGTFYYLIGAVKANNKVIYSSPVALGDRIIIESLTVTDPSENDNGIITVDYLDRGPNDPMSTTPTIKTTKTYGFTDDGHLIELNT